MADLNPQFNLQQHLTDMEDRIRTDIRQIQTIALDTSHGLTVVEGRVTNLEEKAHWVTAGAGTGFLAMCGVLWHMLKGAPRG